MTLSMQPTAYATRWSLGLPHLFALGVFLIPFNGFQTLGVFGEFQAEAAFVIFLPLVFFSLPTIVPGKSPLRYILIAVLAAIVISALINLQQIAIGELRDRSGMNKLVTSVMTVTFMFAFAFTVERWLREPGFMLRFLFRPLFYVALFLLAMAVFQVASWYNGSVGQLYNLALSVLRSRYDEQAEPGRIDTVSFEPSVLALILTCILFMCLGLGPLETKPRRALINFVIVPGIIVILLFGGARTGLISLFAILIFHLVIRLLLPMRLPPSLSVWIAAATFLLIHVVVIVFENDIVANILAGDSISNLSRFAAIAASWEIFKSAPLFGVGLGQYAFRAINLMPSWGWLSPEVVVQFYNPYPSWPPNHSLPLRVASELGIFGVIGYFGLISVLAAAVAGKARREQIRLGAYPFVGHTLVLGYVFVLFSGIAFDSFRQFTVWMTISAMAAYVRYRDPETLFTDILPMNYPRRKKP